MRARLSQYEPFERYTYAVLWILLWTACVLVPPLELHFSKLSAVDFHDYVFTLFEGDSRPPPHETINDKHEESGG